MACSVRSVRGGTLQTLLLAASAGLGTAADVPPANAITVLYHHVTADPNSDLEPSGGFAAFVRFNGRTILFDTGGERTPLLHNSTELKLDLGRLDAVVISHNHWDHTYGLPGILGMAGDNPPVYVPDSAREGLQQQNPRATILAVKKATEIAEGAWVVGPMRLQYRGRPFAEQALVLDDEDGLIVLVGCSHPGIVTIVETVKKQFGDRPIALVAGGFHLRNTPEPEIETIASSLRELGVTRLGPSHCTGDRATEVFRRHWPQHIVRLDLGDTHRF